MRSFARALVRSCTRVGYIVAIGAHAPVRWFHLILNARKAAIDLCGGSPCQLLMSYEKGERKEKGHLRGITRIFTHESLKDKVRPWMRACLMLNTGMHRCKVGCSFFTGHEWEYMCGYIQKDMGKPHYLGICLRAGRTSKSVRVKFSFYVYRRSLSHVYSCFLFVFLSR